MELLPCPFCGGEALPTAHLTYNWFAPVCRRCNARGPSVKIERDSDPQEMRNLMNQADENWNRRASPASAPEGFKHDIGADRFTVVHGPYWWHVRAGEGTQNIGKFRTKRAAEEMALTLLTAFRDGAFMQYQAMLAAAPTPPVSEDRKYAELYKELIYAVASKFPRESRHQTALRYIRNAEKRSGNAAMQEDKP